MAQTRQSIDLQSLEKYRNFASLVSRQQFVSARKALYQYLEEGVPDSILRAMSNLLMKELIIYERATIVPAVFDFLVQQAESFDIRSVNLCLRAFLHTKRFGSALALWEHYGCHVEANATTYDLLICSYVGTKDLAKAEEVIRTLLAEHGPITSTAFAYLLAGIRMQKGSFQEMERVFWWMVSTGIRLHASIYHIMIEDALLSGKPDTAKLYVENMSDMGIKVTADTFGLFMQVQARAGDWDAVRKTMTQLRTKNLRIPTKSFNTILALYAKSRGSENIERLFNLFLNDGAKPTVVSFNILINAYIQEGNEKKALYWTEAMTRRGFRPNASTFNTHFSDLRRHAEPTLLRRVYTASHRINPFLTDEITRSMLVSKMKLSPYQRSPIYIQSPKERAQQRDQRIIEKMESAISQDNLDRAMAYFRESLFREALPSDSLIKLAVKVYFRFRGPNRVEARNILRMARDQGARVNEAMLSFMESSVIAQVAHCRGSYTQLLQRINAVYEYQEENNMEISHKLLSKVASRLIMFGDAVGAVYVMRELSKTPWATKKPFQCAELTVLVRAYGIIRDVEGIKWAVSQLTQGPKPPDQFFMRYLRLARRTFPLGDQHAFSMLLDQCIAHKMNVTQRLNSKAGRLVTVLKKGEVDPPP